jgi:hypothetical protein
MCDLEKRIVELEKEVLRLKQDKPTCPWGKIPYPYYPSYPPYNPWAPYNPPYVWTSGGTSPNLGGGCSSGTPTGEIR